MNTIMWISQFDAENNLQAGYRYHRPVKSLYTGRGDAPRILPGIPEPFGDERWGAIRARRFIMNRNHVSYLARISHHPSTVRTTHPTLPARSSVAKATQAAPLHRLATNGGEQCGLVAAILLAAALAGNSHSSFARQKQSGCRVVSSQIIWRRNPGDNVPEKCLRIVYSCPCGSLPGGKTMYCESETISNCTTKKSLTSPGVIKTRPGKKLER